MKKTALSLPAAGVALFVACGETQPPTEPQPQLDCSVPTDEIFSGGVSRDGIPSLDSPNLLGANNQFMTPDDRVLGVVINGEARAYPLGILWWHEIVNDTLGGEPLLVSYCPLTGSGIAFDRRVGGALLNFGVSGLLFRSNLIMFDRDSESLWNQMLLGSQCGVRRGESLARVPIFETTWGHWIAQHPNSTVLSPDQGELFTNYFEYPYGDYDDLNNPRVDFLAQGVTFSNERPPKELVLGVFDGAESLAFPFGELERAGTASVINDTVGDEPILVTYLQQWRAAAVFDRRVDGQELTFQIDDAGPLTFIDDQTGTTWNAKGTAIAGALQGMQLANYSDAYVAFWFAWSLYYPNIVIRN